MSTGRDIFNIELTGFLSASGIYICIEKLCLRRDICNENLIKGTQTNVSGRLTEHSDGIQMYEISLPVCL